MRMHIRLEITKAQIFQFLLDPVQPQAVGKRSIDIHRLTGNGNLLVRLLKLKRAHVVLTVGQFDNGDTNVMRHGQNHLADIFSLSLLLGVERHLADFCHAVDDIRNLFPEFHLKLINGCAGILHCVMQQPGRHGVPVKPHLGQRQCHRCGVHHVRFARKPHLPGVGGCGIIIGFADHGFIRAGIVVQQCMDDFIGLGHAAALVHLLSFLFRCGENQWHRRGSRIWSMKIAHASPFRVFCD